MNLKSIKIIALILASSSGVMFAMELERPEDRKKIKAYAWQEAFQGNAQKKIDAINSFACARDHEWFQNAITVLGPQQIDKIFFCPPLCEESLIKLLQLITQHKALTPEANDLIALFLNGIKELNSAKAYADCLQRLDGFSSFEIRDKILIGITQGAEEHKHIELLKSTYNKLLGNYYGKLLRDRKDASFYPFVRLLRRFIGLDLEKVQNIVARLKDNYFLNLYNIDETFFEILLLIHDVNPIQFSTFAQKLKKEELGKLIQGFFAYPHYIERCRNTILDFDQLMLFGLRVLAGQEKLDEAGDVFFNALINNIHVVDNKYIEQLIRILPAVISNHKRCSEAMGKLGQTSMLALRISAFNALEGFILSTKDDYDRWQAFSAWLSLNKKTNIAVDLQTTPSKLYQKMYQQLTLNGINECMQRLWRFLLEQSQEELRLLAKAMILDRFCIADSSIEQNNQSFITSVIRTAFAAQQLSNVEWANIIIAARTTSLCIDNRIMQKIERRLLFNYNISMTSRRSLLDNLLTDLVNKYSDNNKKLSKRLQKLSEKFAFLHDDIFKRYALALVKAVDVCATSYETCAAKRELLAIAAEESQLDTDPTVLRKTTGKLFSILKQENQDNQAITKSIEQDVSRVQFSSNLLFGIKAPRWHKEKHILYTCDAHTGFAIWYKKLHSRSNASYALWNDKVYVALKKGTIVVLDANSGKRVERIINSFVGEPRRINITPSGKLFLVQHSQDENRISCIDLATKNVLFSMPVNGFVFDSVVAGESLAAVTSGILECSIAIYSSQGLRAEIDFEEDDEMPMLAKYNDNIVCQRTDSAENKLICYDCSSKQMIWEIKLPEKLKSAPLVSSDKDILYLLTENLIIIVQANSSQDSAQIRSPIKLDKAIAQIIESPDGKALYGVDKEGNIFIYDLNSKTLSLIAETNKKGLRLLRVFNGKIYISA